MPGNSTSRPLALITGLGPGTGAALAHRFSAGGYDVAMLARNTDRLATLEQEITNAKAYACDVTDEAQLDAVIATVKVELGAPSVADPARETRPEPGFAVPTTLRAATTAFAKALAKEAAPFGVQANVVAPNYLYSEMYYPRARFIDDPTGRDTIARAVPFGRLGQQEEVGALIAFLASGKSSFTTGQVIYFAGGWP